MTNYWKLLLPRESAKRKYHIQRYGPELKANKEQLQRVFEVCGIPDEDRALMVAMAMIETKTMSPSERDASKDKKPDKSANVSIFNLNEDMLRELHYPNKDIHQLDLLSSLPTVVVLIERGIRAWNVVRMLNFVRGGRKAFIDGWSFGVDGYRDAVATILRLFDEDPALVTDDRRVEINVPHV
jgi:hypothetical protein